MGFFKELDKIIKNTSSRPNKDGHVPVKLKDIQKLRKLAKEAVKHL